MVLLLEVCTMELNGTHILRYTLGETIPIRLFLGGFELTPTFRGKKKKEVKQFHTKIVIDVNKKFSTRYYLNLVLIDEENRRYFKQQEITLFRRKGKLFQMKSRMKN